MSWVFSLQSWGSIFESSLETGFLYALIPLALFLSYRVLDIADLTTDGCFVLGSAVSVVITKAGYPGLALPVAMLAGACAGFVTAFLHTKWKVPSILAGIITNFGLYTINLFVMGWSSHVSIIKGDTLFSKFAGLGFLGEWSSVVLAGVIVCVVAVLLYLFLGTRLGLSIRATGDNMAMVRASSVNPDFTITLGLCLANSMTGLAGAMVGQVSKTTDINAGTGVVVVGLACLIIGEAIVGKRSVLRGIIAAIVGSILYRFIYTIVLKTPFPIEGLKLIVAVVVAVAIAFPYLKSWGALQKKKSAHAKEV